MLSNKFTSNILILSSLTILILGIFFFIHKDRELHWGYDDYFQFLSKSSYFEICNKENSNCDESIKFIFNQGSDQLSTEKNYKSNRQIQRLIIEYNYLYTFILEKFSTLKNQEYIQMNLNIFLTVIQSFFVFYILKKNFSNFWLIL